jgi:uncharacterized heparinase superfamily protein
MTPKPGKGSLGNRLAMWRARRSPPALGFVSTPEPRSIGLYSKGRQLVAGNFLFAGTLTEAPGVAIWDVPVPDPLAAEQRHGFVWLDDLAALGDSAARTRAQDWTWDWIARYGAGQGPGWSPDLTGRRLIRWINHAILLLNGQDRTRSEAYYRSASAQVVFLSRRWKHAAPGLPRFEALTGLIYAGLALTGMQARIAPALAALAQDCDHQIDSEGGIPTRNPEDLLEVFTLLTWAEQALTDAGVKVPLPLITALERMAPCLRALRHADGGLARFHGGGRGMEGRLDQALAATGVRPLAQNRSGLAMGFARLSEGRTTVVVDAAPPPGGAAGRFAHASTTAFELTSGRRPLVVSCGSGALFGPEWRQAGRATASHSTLAIDGYSSSRMAPGETEVLTDLAQVTNLRLSHLPEGPLIYLAHNGWSGTHGLTHARHLHLSADGRKLTGTDTLAASTLAERKRFEQIMQDGRMEAVRLDIRFHLHPDVDAALDLGGTAISLALKSGEIWVFRHDGSSKLALEPSVYLEKSRLRPRATRQIVLSARALDLETRIGWTLAKAQDTPLAIRDLDRSEMPVPI